MSNPPPAPASSPTLAQHLGLPPWWRLPALLGSAALALIPPFYLEAFWLQLAAFAFAAVLAALGFNLLLGETGLFSFSHPFFAAIGAYGYATLASENHPTSNHNLLGAGLPPALAALGAVVLAGLVALILSPIATRLRGLALAITTLGLVLLGQHVLFNATAFTGGFNGRDIPPLTLFGNDFDNPATAPHIVGVPFGRREMLWYVGVTVAVLAYLYHRNLTRGRVGWALHAIRDQELAAAILGVAVSRYKTGVFVLSAGYASTAGVLLALALQRVVPETFGLLLAIEYLAMVIIGGLGSGPGVVFGAVFVSTLSVLAQRYSDVLPVLAENSAEGITPQVAARFFSGAALVAFLIVEPGGAAALGRRLAHLIIRYRARRAARRP